MKTLLAQAAFAVSMTLFLNGCGLNKAIDATESVPGKVDATNEEVKKTNGYVKETNGHVKETNLHVQETNKYVKETNDHVKETGDAVKETNSKMDTMVGEVKKSNDGITKTNLAVHRQTLAVALEDLKKEENTRYLYPPLAMLPAGKVFALEATPDELIEITHVFLTYVEKTPANEEDTANPNRFDHLKQARLTAASVLAGLAPQETVLEIIKTQIEAGGPFEQSAYSFLMLRFWFLNEFFVKAPLEAKQLTNPGMIRNTVQYAEGISWILSLPFAPKVTMVTTGFLSSEKNSYFTMHADANEALKAWKKIDRAFDTTLDPKYRDSTTPVGAELAKLRASVKDQISKFSQSVDKSKPAVDASGS